MQTLFFFFTSLIASIVAVKLTVTALKAGRHDWLSCVIAVVLSLVVLTTISNLIAAQITSAIVSQVLILVVSVLVVGFVLESILETTFINGMVAAAVAVVIQWLVKIVFSYLGVNTEMLSFIMKLVS